MAAPTTPKETQQKSTAIAIWGEWRALLLPKVAGPVQFFGTPETVDEDTGGWSIRIAQLRRPKLAIELWFDDWANAGRRCIWHGLRGRDEAVFGVCSSYRRRPDKELTETDVGNGTLKVPLSKSRSLLVYEKYKGESFFGIYNTRDKPGAHLDVPTGFIVNCLEILGISEYTNIDGDYGEVENRQTVAWHLKRERKSGLAEKCKRRDNYICQICSFSFQSAYGDLGCKFAEAHHKIPLSKLDGPTINTSEALITVCANCHRMLHRMRGDEGDIQELRQQLRRPKANG